MLRVSRRFVSIVTDPGWRNWDGKMWIKHWVISGLAASHCRLPRSSLHAIGWPSILQDSLHAHVHRRPPPESRLGHRIATRGPGVCARKAFWHGWLIGDDMVFMNTPRRNEVGGNSRRMISLRLAVGSRINRDRGGAARGEQSR